MKSLTLMTIVAFALALTATALGSRASAQVTARSSAYGNVLFSAGGRALYVFGADKGSTSRCYGVCAQAWPPLLTAGTPVAGIGVRHMLLGTARRRDGTVQVTYRGHPLYTYSADKRGKIGCQHVSMHGGLWLVIQANGRVSTAKGRMHMG